jgi:hypothetical protein
VEKEYDKRSANAQQMRRPFFSNGNCDDAFGGVLAYAFVLTTVI